ncbi:MAG: hypothetical protein L6R36_000055 [Xanthoria steineri]|nr:MAG: hypothetical protein L6R36_000055 [Xanthoria steineri]
MDDGRVKAFRLLKPPCVELSQAALRYKVSKSTAKDLLKCLERLTETLLAVSHSLDAKLADYVFFPLSHVFGESKELPPRLLERALSCLRLLIRQGWRDRLSSEVGKQLLILLAFLAGGSATESKAKQVDEDVAAIALDCTASLFHSSVASSLGSHSAILAENVPLLGHTLTVILDAISNPSATKVRLAACTSLHALVDGIADEDALRNFFPGIVSCLTKILSSGIRSKTPWKVLQVCIQLFDQILRKILTDDAIPSAVVPDRTATADKNPTNSWITATASQVKVALSTVLPLRYHHRDDVQEALFTLCVSVLTDCRMALGNCNSMILEALVALSSHAGSEDGQRRSQRLQQIFASNLDLLEVLKDSLYDWTVTLPRVVASNDGTRQTRTLEQLSTALQLLSAHDLDMRALNDLVTSNLRTSVASAIELSSTHAITSVASESAEVSRVLQSTTSSGGDHIFTPVIFDSTSQGNTMAGLQMLVEQFERSTMSVALHRSLTESLQSTTGNEQIATLWLMLQSMVHQSPHDSEIEQWLNLPSDHLEPLAEEAYSFSLEILDRSAYDEAVDWRLQALSLEVVALQAKHQGQDFRPELVDALYPILERMGSNNAALQQHAVTCLGIVSDRCGYPSASELIVHNADYLVNAVAIKLNTFDISPQASQVMLMMVRLCGSAIIPYLDDLIESIFAILACYHGYPRLVELLFEVLNAIVEEGAKASPRAIEPATRTTPSPRRPYKPTTIADVIARLHLVKNRSDRTSPPSTPLPEPDPEVSSTPEPEPEPPQPSSAENPPPQSKAHTLIHMITQQTTHHLSTPSPPLRRLLLSLIASSLPCLSPQSTIQSDDDTTFLPLIATLWPHVTRQIFPSTSYSPPTTPPADLPTLLTALQTLTTLSQHGGSFLLSRFSDLLPQLQTLYQQLEQGMLHEEKTLGRSRTSRGIKAKTWDQMVGLVVSMVEYVGITREMEDGVFEMMGGEPLARGRDGVRGALEGVNPDAVWLLEEAKRSRKEDGWDEELEKRNPVIEGWEFRSVNF